MFKSLFDVFEYPLTEYTWSSMRKEEEVDVSRTRDNKDIVYTIDVPGFNKENLSIEISNSVLLITGETENRKIDRKYGIYHIQYESVEAEVKDGILTLTFVKSAKSPIKVTIK